MRISSNRAMAKAMVERDRAGGSWFKLIEKRPSFRLVVEGDDVDSKTPSEAEYKSRLDAIEA